MLPGSENMDKIKSIGQTVDIEGIQLFSLSIETHKLTAAQVVYHDLLYRFGALNMKHTRGRVGEYSGTYLLAGLNTYIVVRVFHTQGTHARENDIVHPSAVTAIDDTRILLVAEFEGVRAGGDWKGGLRPTGVPRLAVHLGVVDIEFEEVIAVFRRDFAEIGDACSGGTVDHDEEFRLVVVGQVLFGTDAIVAGVRLLIGDEPWVVVGLPQIGD